MDLPSFEEPVDAENSNEFGDADRQSPQWRSVWLAWIVVFASIALTLLPHFAGGKKDAGDSSIVVQEIQAKYLVGVSSVPFAPKVDFRNEISKLFDHGPLRRRLMGIVLRGEFKGPEAAAKSLQVLERLVETQSIATSPSDDEVRRLLLKVQLSRIEKGDLEAGFSDDERSRAPSLLRDRLGWVGKLAMLPPGTEDQAERSKLIGQAQRTLFTILGAAAFVVIATICGVVLQIVWWIFAASGRLRSGIGSLRRDDVIYGETFAMWMAVYVALSYLISQPVFRQWGMVALLVPQIGGLAALAWPVFRGLHWRDVRQDIGLTIGRQFWSAPFVGVGTYLSAIPAVIFGAIITVSMMAVAGQLGAGRDDGSSPIHPIVELILRGNWTSRLQVLLVVVFAAVPEEIMFRGVLYRFLRESGANLGYVGSVLFATLISSFIFAAIHPQGIFGIPILMGLAIVFALAREWRGTLIPSMIAHAMINAGTSTVLFLIAD